MKILSTLLIFGLIVLTAGCHFDPKVPKDVTYDYNVNYDFSTLKTYAWEPISTTVAGIDNFTANRIKKAANAELLAKGLTMTVDNPDFLIITYGGSDQMPTVTWRGIDAPLYYEKGRLHFAFLDPKTDEVIWSGKAETKLDVRATPENEDGIINEVVQRIFTKFPPNPSN